MLARIASSPNGFSMKSTAPAFMALTASGTSAWPVMTMTGTWMPPAANFSWNSRPSISGMRTSVTMQAGACPAGGQRVRRRFEGLHRMTGGFEQQLQQIAHRLVIVHDKDQPICRHHDHPDLP